jgi:predicted nucleotide-binding protein (sugar kinase/HSP70/actin superfamily)
MVSFCKGEYNCPKILGLPDVVRNLFQMPQGRIIDDEINMRDKGILGWRQGYIDIGRHFTTNDKKILNALQKAEKAHQDYRKKLKEGFFPDNLIDHRPVFQPQKEKVLLLGHTYLINDSHINMGILQKIHTMGYSIITTDMVDERKIRSALQTIPKPSFWTISNEVMGSALYSIQERQTDLKGFIHLVSFECGPDSLVGELIERWLKRERRSIPYLRLEIDEHTGEAGLVTRLEAFVDMMKWRAESLESNFSSPRPS